MKALKAPLLLCVLTAIVAVPAHAEPPCVPPGGMVTVDFGNPTLQPGAEITGARASEQDDATPNDPMGKGDATGTDQTSVNVSNSGGDLSGPNGEVQNGGGEGDCIEVIMVWSIRQEVKHTWYVEFGPISYSVSWSSWKYYEIESDSQEVCPC